MAAAARFIDPDLLEVDFKSCVCAVCAGVIQDPVSGCPGGHSLCRPCYEKSLQSKKLCPLCRHKVYKHKLTRNHALAGLVDELPMKRCEFGVAPPAEEEPMEGSAAKRARLAEAPAPCKWKGNVGQLAWHRGECLWEKVKCPYKMCKDTPLRMDWEKHEAVCGIRLVF